MFETKVCTHCKEDLPIDDFHVDRRKKDGHDTWCKGCVREYNRTRARCKHGNPRASCGPCAIEANKRLYPDAWKRLSSELVGPTMLPPGKTSNLEEEE